MHSTQCIWHIFGFLLCLLIQDLGIQPVFYNLSKHEFASSCVKGQQCLLRVYNVFKETFSAGV